MSTDTPAGSISSVAACSSAQPAHTTLSTHVWIIANPVGGGGKTPGLVIPLLRMLANRFVDFKPVSVRGCIELVNTRTGAEGAARRETCHALFTAAVGDGIRLASEVAKEIAQLPSGDASRCFVIPVGGDGTLSEVVHGLSSTMLRELGLPASSLPNIVYLAAGTGADFARLGHCCKEASEVMRVINASAFVDPSKAKEFSADNGTYDESVCGVRRIDVGCVTQVQSKVFRYFTNEASVGLSNAVVVCAENFKRKRWISCFGGGAVFLAAGAYELLKMKAHRFRVRKLPNITSGQSSIAEPIASPKETSTQIHIPKECMPVKDCMGPASAEQQRKDWEQGDWVYLDSTALAFGNGQYFGGGMRICPHGDPCDQTLAISSWGETVLGFATGVPSLYNGNATSKWKTSRAFNGSRVLVELAPVSEAERDAEAKKSSKKSDNALTSPTSPIGQADPPPHAFMETDGEPIGALPAIVEISHQINFLLPLPKPSKKNRKQN